jgi:1,4-dihydroxy-2-naphthoate octaprenyltransferase
MAIPAERDAGPRARDVWQSFRVFSLPVSVGPVLVATAVALPVSRWRWDILAASVIGVGLLHVAGNLLNAYFDFRAGVDSRLEGDTGRPGRQLVRGQLRPRHVLTEAVVCLLGAGATTAYLLLQCGVVVAWFGLVALIGLYSYTGPPLQLKYRALGEPVVFLLFGPLLFGGAAWVQTGGFNLGALLFSIPFGMATTAILVSNNVRDSEEDQSAGIRTLGTVADGILARVLYVVLTAGAVAVLAVLSLAGRAPAVLVLSPLVLVLLAGPLRAVARGRRLPDIDARTARFETVLLAVVFLACVASPTFPS